MEVEDLMSGGRLFQVSGAATLKARFATVLSFLAQPEGSCRKSATSSQGRCRRQAPTGS